MKIVNYTAHTTQYTPLLYSPCHCPSSTLCPYQPIPTVPTTTATTTITTATTTTTTSLLLNVSSTKLLSMKPIRMTNYFSHSIA